MAAAVGVSSLYGGGGGDTGGVSPCDSSAEYRGERWLLVMLSVCGRCDDERFKEVHIFHVVRGTETADGHQICRQFPGEWSDLRIET